jgi:hypothetical protein
MRNMVYDLADGSNLGKISAMLSKDVKLTLREVPIMSSRSTWSRSRRSLSSKEEGSFSPKKVISG